MDKGKECDVPERVFTGDVSMESGEKHSNFFKEPAGMTTICLSDAPIPDESKSMWRTFCTFNIILLLFKFLGY